MKAIVLKDGTKVRVHERESEAVHHGAGSEPDKAARRYLTDKGWLGPVEEHGGHIVEGRSVEGHPVEALLLVEYKAPHWVASLHRDDLDVTRCGFVMGSMRTGPGVETAFQMLWAELTV